MKKLLLLLSIIWTISAFGQATIGFHRVNQLLQRGISGTYAQVVPRATIAVASTATGLQATIYLDPLLTAPITSSTVTSDANGNYGYYVPLNYCVDETVSSPGAGSYTTTNICGNTGTIQTPVAVLNGGTGATSFGGAWTNIFSGAGITANCSLLQNVAGVLTCSATTPPAALAVLGGTPTTTTVNGHVLSSNVVVSASDLTTGTLPHAQLPSLLSGDIPNNSANTSGNAATASNLTGTPALPNGTTASTQPVNSVDSELATDTTVLNAFATPPTSGYGSTTPAPVSVTTVTFQAARKSTFVCTSGGTITVSNTNMLVTSNVIISLNTAGGTISTPPAMKTVTAASGFTVLCATSDTSTYNYVILN